MTNVLGGAAAAAPTDSDSAVSRVPNSLWWEDKLNSIPLYHLALIKPNFPGALTSDELGSYAKKQTTQQLTRAEWEHNIMQRAGALRSEGCSIVQLGL